MSRSYRSRTRDASAKETRVRILTAAKILFSEDGFDKVTIAKLAQLAGVSKPTVYAVYKSKLGVLQALIDSSLPEESFESLTSQVKTESCPRKRMAITASIARQIYEAESELMGLIRGAALLSPEVKQLEEEREERRYERQAASVRRLHKEKALREGLSLVKARDIFWTLTGRDLYRLFVNLRGWSPEQYESWLEEMLCQSLLTQE